MRQSKSFGKRLKVFSTSDVVKKYFLVYEGKATEAIYFEAVSSLKDSIGIDPLIELVPLIRSYSEEGWSNPKKILDRVIDNIQESITGNISYETLLNYMMDCFIDEQLISGKMQTRTTWGLLVSICKNKFHKELNDCVDNLEAAYDELIEGLKHKMGIMDVVTDISEIINSSQITYAEGYDKICLIVDRDKHSFVEHENNRQYRYVLDKCVEHNFSFIVTNPCFEFWLLLHFEDISILDKDKLLENPLVTSKKRYTEYELRKRMSSFNKSSYDAEALVRKVDIAVDNEKLFCENIEELEHKLGSNVGLLIQEMRKEKDNNRAR